MQKKTVIFIVALVVAACGRDASEEPVIRDVFTMDDVEIFPAARNLQRPEDGVLLKEGALIVADQRYGLVAIAPDGAVRPFGNFAAAGYRYDPPAHHAGPNGVSMEPDGVHILVADVFSGAIYRTSIIEETTERIYQHPFGVNTAKRDSTGALWFTQSTENIGENTETRLFEAVEYPMPDGALFRIAPAAENPPQPELKVSGLNFANGFDIDEGHGALYLSETASDRVLGFALDLETGDLSNRRVVASVMTPDNMELRGDGSLWVASPVTGQILSVDIESGEIAPVFSPDNPRRDDIVEEWRRRGETGEARLDLLGPEIIGALPGLPTGMIINEETGGFYVTGLGDAIVKVDGE